MRTVPARQETASTCRGYNWCMGNLFRKGSSTVLEPTSRDPQTTVLAQGSLESGSDVNPSRESTVAPPILHRPTITALILGVVGLLVFLAGIGRPVRTYYDEAYFVPEARTFLLKAPNPSTQLPPPLARPPLGKMIMAMGMKAAGDNPFGWRVAAAFCGALTLAAVYLWTLLLLRDSQLAIFAAGLTLFKGPFLLLLLPGCDDPGCAHRRIYILSKEDFLREIQLVAIAAR